MPLQYLVMLVVALLVTPPFILLIPHARQSPAFDRLLWAATLALAFLGGWIAFDNLGPVSPAISVAGVPVLPIVIGALAAGVALNLILLLLDHFEGPEGIEPEEDEREAEELEEDRTEMSTAEDVDKHDGDPTTGDNADGPETPR